ncbi:PPE family protein PPE36, partial [Mycobacterium tuberculosis BTB07-243]
MPNFWALPPEINSTRIYLGPGSGPILAAAQGWNALASELEKTKVGLQSALDTLLESYRGQSSQALIQQTLPYVQWLTTTAEHAHKTAIQLTAAANAYEQARAAMVPPAMVRANRVQTTVLKAINWFGQFSTRIADKEADYEQMWFQDALVMENYWEAVQEAIQSTSHFEDPPEMADDEPPRHVRRLQFLERMGSCQVVHRGGTRRSCVSGRCGWSQRSAVSTIRSGQRSVRSPVYLVLAARRRCVSGCARRRSMPAHGPGPR